MTPKAKSGESGNAKLATAKTPADDTIKLGALSYRTPRGLTAASLADARKLKIQIESSMHDMANPYQADAGRPSDRFRIDAFRAFQLPGRDGWVVSHLLRIPPQKDYLSALEQEQRQKIQWGQEKGWVTRVFEQGLIEVNGADLLKVDTAVRDGRRTIGFFHWSEKDPGSVAQISIVINPGRYNTNTGKIEALIESIRVDE